MLFREIGMLLSGIGMALLKGILNAYSGSATPPFEGHAWIGTGIGERSRIGEPMIDRLRRSVLHGPQGRGTPLMMDEERGRDDGVDIGEEGIVIEARVIAQSFGLDPPIVLSRIRGAAITFLCGAGIDADAGRHRLTVFHASRLLRLVVDQRYSIVRRSVVDFGSQPIAPSAKRHENRARRGRQSRRM